MQEIRSILVVLDPRHRDDPSVTRAALIAKGIQAHLHLLVVDNSEDHHPWLRQLRQDLASNGLDVDIEQATNYEHPHEAIIAVQQQQGCGLVIKHHAPDNPLKKALLTPADWKLLRFCPVPVLMVKHERNWQAGKVLAAVDVGNNDRAHKALHASIVRHAHEIASLGKGELHVVSAHPSPILSAADPTFQLRDNIAGHYRQECKAFQDEYGIADDKLHIPEGPADVLIPRLAKQLDAVVTVIGTVARTGISGALIGNTAEVILDALESDVLVLKPEEISDHLEQLASQF